MDAVATRANSDDDVDDRKACGNLERYREKSRSVGVRGIKGSGKSASGREEWRKKSGRVAREEARRKDGGESE